VAYFVDKETELLDYEAIEKQALEVRPQIIVAGYSAYPMIVDWARFRQIADKCGAYLMADIAHISGLVAAGVHPSPIGIADVVTTTTHKSLCGPRGAMILTHRRDLANKIDRAVFPGEQGGPHLNTMAALAVALKLAKTEQFRSLQQRIVANARRLAAKLAEAGLRIVGGGTENHLFMIDTGSVSHNGVHLAGDIAARVLDVAGIVVNRNTIPSDKGALNPTGLRIGTVWISQLGFGEVEIDLLAEAIATALKGCTPFAYMALGGKEMLRAKVDAPAIARTRAIVRQLRGVQTAAPESDRLTIRGEEVGRFLNTACASDVLALGDGDWQGTVLLVNGTAVQAHLSRQSESQYSLTLPDKESAGTTLTWLRDLSDGYLRFDEDLYSKLPGPVVITFAGSSEEKVTAEPSAVASSKPYFIGHRHYEDGAALPEFNWTEPAEPPLLRTTLHQTHVEMGAKMVPFAGYDMPVWYSSVSEEHKAVRETAGLFDVTHMGVLEASGPQVVEFLNTVTTNDVSNLAVGQSHYTYLLLPGGSVVDDLLIYRRGPEKFMLVVNASNNDKDWAWLTAVNQGEVLIDRERPFAHIQQPVSLRDLRDPQHGEECRVDIALQGPRATDILLALCEDAALAKRIKALAWAGLLEGNVGGFDLVISRTGYTGERVAYELFVHPDKAPAFWQALVQAGEPFGLRACGLAARDSTRTEAGLPLYGHELAGPLALNPAEAGFGAYVKLWKPFFVGRAAFITAMQKLDRSVVRFRMNEKGVRRAELGDPVLDRRGKVVGTVTSCAIDAEGYLLGQAAVPQSMSRPATPLAIYQLGGGTREIQLPKAIQLGARLPTPDGATVLTRFPERKKK
jgi:glycine hydroxymethyltransferase